MKKTIFIAIMGLLMAVSCSKSSDLIFDGYEEHTTDPSIPIPNGKMVFCKWDGNLYTINLDGSNEKQITFEGKGGTQRLFWQPTWSPNGSQILYIGGFTHLGINIMDQYGSISSRKFITKPPYLTTEVYYNSLDWFPDGNRIAYLVFGRLNIVGMNGEEIKEIKIASSSFSMSPDGNGIAYSGSTISPGMHILDLDSEESYNLTQHHFIDHYWSPDGSKLAGVAYTSVSKDFDRLVIIDINTGQERTIMESMDDIILLGWTRDGKNLIYKLRIDDSFNIMNISTGGVRHLFKNSESRYEDLYLE